jgi:tetratricopeptide (TPR) repeat protein
MALYDAFVSYSHAKDKPIAAALQSVVQRLGKPWYRRRALRIFRDDTSLSATPHLWPTIEQALGQSRFLILLASPEAAASHWVNKEVAYWLEAKSADTLLIAVTDGKLKWDHSVEDFAWGEGTPLPPALKGRFAVEPKWVDLTAYRDGADKRDAKFTELAADFAAAIRGMPKEDLLSQEVRQQRKALTLAWSAAGSLLILAGIAGWQSKVAIDNARTANEQRRIAEQQTGIAKSEGVRAERNFGAAKSTVDAVIFDLAQGLKDVEGMRVETVRRILERAEAAVGRLASRTENDPEVRHSQMVMFNLFSETYQKLGATQLAVEYAQKALDIARDLAARDPDNSRWTYDISISLNRIGDVLAERGDLAGALAAHREDVELSRALSDRSPGDANLRRGISVSLHKLGDLLKFQGNAADALAAFREALGIDRGLAQKEPGNPQRRRDLHISLNDVGSVLRITGDLASALAAYREGLAIARELSTQDPDNTEWRRDVSGSLDRIGSVLSDQGNLVEALAAYREDLAIVRGLSAKDPGNTQWERDVALACRLPRASRRDECAFRQGRKQHAMAERPGLEPAQGRRRAQDAGRSRGGACQLSPGSRNPPRAFYQGPRQQGLAARPRNDEGADRPGT